MGEDLPRVYNLKLMLGLFFNRPRIGICNLVYMRFGMMNASAPFSFRSSFVHNLIYPCFPRLRQGVPRPAAARVAAGGAAAEHQESAQRAVAAAVRSGLPAAEAAGKDRYIEYRNLIHTH